LRGQDLHLRLEGTSLQGWKNLIGTRSGQLKWSVGSAKTCFSVAIEERPALTVSKKGTALGRLRAYVLRATDFLTSQDGEVMARLFTGIHEDKKLRRLFLERYVPPRRDIQGRIIEDAIAAGEVKRDTNSDLLIDALNGPLFFRWLQGHAPLDQSIAESIFKSVIPAFRTEGIDHTHDRYYRPKMTRKSGGTALRTFVKFRYE